MNYYPGMALMAARVIGKGVLNLGSDKHHKHFSISVFYGFYRLSFALASQSKNKASHNKTSTPVKRSSREGGANVLAMTPHDSIIQLQQTIGNQAVQRLLRSKPRRDCYKALAFKPN